jgi:hypothetical protein
MDVDTDVQMDGVDLAPPKSDLVSMWTTAKLISIHRILVLLFVRQWWRFDLL